MTAPGSIRLKFTDSTKALKGKKSGPPVGHFFLRARDGDNEPWRLSVWLPRGLAPEPVDEKDYHDVVDGESYATGSQALVAQILQLAQQLWADQCAMRVNFYRTMAEVPGDMVRLKGFFKAKTKQAWWAQLQNEQHRARSHYERQSLARLEDAWQAGWPKPSLAPHFPWTGHPERVSWEIARKALWEIVKQQDKIRWAQEDGQRRRQLQEAQEAAQGARESPEPAEGDQVLVTGTRAVPEGLYEVGKPASEAGSRPGE